VITRPSPRFGNDSARTDTRHSRIHALNRQPAADANAFTFEKRRAALMFTAYSVNIYNTMWLDLKDGPLMDPRQRSHMMPPGT